MEQADLLLQLILGRHILEMLVGDTAELIVKTVDIYGIIVII
jgi:hypothetical protein